MQNTDLTAPPSRASNPFATCWTRPGALAFQFPACHSAERLVARLTASQWQGEILGPHGSGKSTLIEALKPALLAEGCDIWAICLREGQRSLPPGFLTDSLGAFPGSALRTLLIIDGYEQLGWFQRRRLLRRCRRAAIGLLVTSHVPTGLPTLIALMPDLALVQRLVNSVRLHASTPIKPADVVASHARFGSNVRELFFDLYDRHERLRSGE